MTFTRKPHIRFSCTIKYGSYYFNVDSSLVQKYALIIKGWE